MPMTSVDEAAKPVEPPEIKSPALEDLVKRKAFSPPIAPEYLRDHLYFGPEVTFSSDLIADWNGFTRVDSPSRGKFTETFTLHPGQCANALRDLTRGWFDPIDHAACCEFVRFLYDVVRPVRGVVQLKRQLSTEGGGLSAWQERQLELPDMPFWVPYRCVHTGNSLLSALVRDSEGRWLTLNAEPGCLEVNRAPVLLKHLRSRWKSLMDRANENDFCGSPYFASGGGGGHINFSFGSHRLGPLIEYPELLGRFLMIPQVLPGVVHCLSELGDRGISGTALRLFDCVSNLSVSEDLTVGSYLRFRDMVKGMLAPSSSGSHVSMTYPETGGLKVPYLAEHDAAINLKNFPYSIETRIMRAFGAYDYLEAGCTFLSKVLEHLTDITFEFCQGILTPISSSSVGTLKKQFRRLLDDIQIS